MQGPLCVACAGHGDPLCAWQQRASPGLGRRSVISTLRPLLQNPFTLGSLSASVSVSVSVSLSLSLSLRTAPFSPYQVPESDQDLLLPPGGGGVASRPTLVRSNCSAEAV